MKIAITGHTAGIGHALAEEYRLDGNEIVGLSQREGNNIRNTPKICDQIEPCDVFVNTSTLKKLEPSPLNKLLDFRA